MVIPKVFLTNGLPLARATMVAVRLVGFVMGAKNTPLFTLTGVVAPTEPTSAFQ